LGQLQSPVQDEMISLSDHEFTIDENGDIIIQAADTCDMKNPEKTLYQHMHINCSASDRNELQKQKAVSKYKLDLQSQNQPQQSNPYSQSYYN